MTETGENEIDSDIEEKYDKDAAYFVWRYPNKSWWCYGISTSGNLKKLHLRVHLFCELLCHVILYMYNKHDGFQSFFYYKLLFQINDVILKLNKSIHPIRFIVSCHHSYPSNKIYPKLSYTILPYHIL